MSQDLKVEGESYRAVENVAKLPWRSVKERAFKNIIHYIMLTMGWTTVSIVEDKLNEPTGKGE